MGLGLGVRSQGLGARIWVKVVVPARTAAVAIFVTIGFSSRA